MNELALWVFAALLHLVPLESAPSFPGWEETIEDREARYRSIAKDIAAVVEADSGRAKPRDKAALLIAIAVGETRLEKSTDVGPCYRGKRGGKLWGRCDSGRAATIWQLQGAWGEPKPLTPSELFADRRRAARIALRAARSSLSQCRRLPARDRLSALGGRCVVGHEGARGHYDRWMRVRVWSP